MTAAAAVLALAGAARAQSAAEIGPVKSGSNPRKMVSLIVMPLLSAMAYSAGSNGAIAGSSAR